MPELVRYRSFGFDSARWAGFPFRSGDIVISTPPKCGTTWTQRLVALLVFGSADLPAPLAELSPWLDQQTKPLADVVASLEAQAHRRFIKTHTPFDGLPWRSDVTYVGVGRDPRDVALSWDAHISNIDIDAFVTIRAAAVGLDDVAELGMTGPPPPPPDDPSERFQQWVDADMAPSWDRGLAMTLHHYRCYWEHRHDPNVVLLHYSDLLADLPGQLRRLADALAIEVDDERLHELAATASFDAMKADATTFVPNRDDGFWRSPDAFFRRGGSGQWRDVVSAEALAHYDERVAALEPDAALVAWAHGGATTP